MSNSIGYSLGCVTPVRYTFTQGEDVTGNSVSSSVSGCNPGCWNGDYRDRSYWARLPRSTTPVSGTDYYGALAPELKFQGGGTYREICPTVCYCEGPVAEGETVTKYLDRYETRWMALLVEGLLYYGRVDGTLIQAPLDLFPDPLSDTATHIALSFDASARPVFAYEDEGTIHVRRYVAGTPTTYAWTGTEPCLFFNGVVNFDDTQTDVVCYHLTDMGGSLYARIQREAFGVANLVAEDPELTALAAVDRGRGAIASYMVIELSGKRAFASVYPPWPVAVGEAARATLAITADGICSETVMLSGPYGEAGEATLALAADGSCDTWTLVQTYAELPVTATLSITPNGACNRVILVTGPYSEATSATVTIGSNGSCSEIVVSGGSYPEAATATISLSSDGDCSTV